MTELDTILGPLELRLGRPVTMRDLAPLAAKHIAELTDDDLVVIEAFHGPAARAAKEAARDRWHTPAPPSTPDVATHDAAPESSAPLPPDELADVLIDIIKKALEAPKARLADLEQRVMQLETQPKALDYHGTWQRAVLYERNAMVTHKSVTWACLAQARGVEPGTAPAVWQLAEKGDVR